MASLTIMDYAKPVQLYILLEVEEPVFFAMVKIVLMSLAQLMEVLLKLEQHVFLAVHTIILMLQE